MWTVGLGQMGLTGLSGRALYSALMNSRHPGPGLGAEAGKHKWQFGILGPYSVWDYAHSNPFNNSSAASFLPLHLLCTYVYAHMYMHIYKQCS